MEGRSLVVSLSGLHGTGKSSYARELANSFELEVVSSGELFRQIAEERDDTLLELSETAQKSAEIDERIDETVRERAKKGGVVAEGLLTGWFLRDVADVRIALKAPLEVRVKRIANRESKAEERIRQETLEREESEKSRFKEYYGLNIDDYSIYHVVIDTAIAEFDSITEALITLIEGHVEGRGA